MPSRSPRRGPETTELPASGPPAGAPHADFPQDVHPTGARCPESGARRSELPSGTRPMGARLRDLPRHAHPTGARPPDLPWHGPPTGAGHPEVPWEVHPTGARNAEGRCVRASGVGRRIGFPWEVRPTGATHVERRRPRGSGISRRFGFPREARSTSARGFDVPSEVRPAGSGLFSGEQVRILGVARTDGREWRRTVRRERSASPLGLSARRHRA